MEKVYLISPVRLSSPELEDKVRAVVDHLESTGYEVHWPARDTAKEGGEQMICFRNRNAMAAADKVVVVAMPDKSKGCMFDLGMAFGLSKPVCWATEEGVSDYGCVESTDYFLKALSYKE